MGGCFATSRSAFLKTVNRIMKKVIIILQENQKSSAKRLGLRCTVRSQQDSDPKGLDFPKSWLELYQGHMECTEETSPCQGVDYQKPVDGCQKHYVEPKMAGGHCFGNCHHLLCIYLTLWQPCPWFFRGAEPCLIHLALLQNHCCLFF